MKHISTLIPLVLLLAACNRDVQQQLQPKRVKKPQGVVRFTGEIGNDNAQTKTAFDFGGAGSGTINTIWSESDCIGIFGAGTASLGSNIMYVASPATGNPSSAGFDFDDESLSAVGYLSGCSYYAYHPYSASQSTSLTEIDCSVPNVQTFASGDNPSKSFLVARALNVSSANVDLSFRNLFSTITFQLKGTGTIRSMTFKPVNPTAGVILAGDYTCDLTATEIIPQLKTGGKTYNSITLQFPDGLTLTSSAQNVSIGVVPFTIPPEGMILTFHYSDGQFIKTLWKDKSNTQRAIPSAANIHIGQPIANITSNTDDIERAALMALYNSAGGDSWTNKTNWGSSKALWQWYGVGISSGRVATLDLRNNNLSGTIPPELGNLTQLDYLALFGNNLTGTIPEELGNCRFASTCYLHKNYLSGSIPQSLWNHPNAAEFWFGPQLGGNQLFAEEPVPEGTPLHADGEVEMYISATNLSASEKAYPLVITCDGFTAADRAVGGLAEKRMKEAADAIFIEEPFRSLKNYFDVYLVYAHSAERGITFVDYTVNNRWGTTQLSYDATSMQCTNDSGMFSFLKKATGISSQASGGNTFVCVPNSVVYAGTCWTWSTGTTLGINPAYKGFGEVVCHETGGHSIGHLADEYINQSAVASHTQEYAEQVWSSNGWYANIDFTSDAATIKWSAFLSDARYAAERANNKLGVFEGAYYRSSGAWRPSANSIMNNNSGGYNVASREAIYKLVHKKCRKYPTLNPFRYDYETFVAFDQPAREAAATRASGVLRPRGEMFGPFAPPVIVDAMPTDGQQ